VEPSTPFQPSLFDREPPRFDETFGDVERIFLDGSSWVDHAPGWLRGSDAVFFEVLSGRDWGQRTRWMYEGRVNEPRLTAPWSLASGEPLRPEILERVRLALSTRYGTLFDSAGFNLYRDGHDGVAWHSDKIAKEVEAPVIALLSLGEPRKLLLRPKGGGPSVPFLLGRGDLLVVGGATNRSYEHSVPKAARAGPRISVAYRHDLDRRAYAGEWTRRAPGEGSSSG
jgi:alkylated DNA repair dioxygenase AlkB